MPWGFPFCFYVRAPSGVAGRPANQLAPEACVSKSRSTPGGTRGGRSQPPPAVGPSLVSRSSQACGASGEALSTGPSGLTPSPQTLALVLSSQAALSLVAPAPSPALRRPPASGPHPGM